MFNLNACSSLAAGHSKRRWNLEEFAPSGIDDGETILEFTDQAIRVMGNVIMRNAIMRNANMENAMHRSLFLI